MLNKIADKFQRNEQAASLALIVFSILILHIITFNYLAGFFVDINSTFMLNILMAAILLLPGIVSGIIYCLMTHKRKKAFLILIVTDVLWFFWFANYAGVYLKDN